jgi:hypothetical protein
MDKENKEVTITAQGSLAVLALGSVGIKKWRTVVQQKEKEQDKNDEEEDGKEINE